MFQLVTKSEQVLFNISPGKDGELQHISKMPCKELPFLLIFIMSFLIWLLPILHQILFMVTKVTGAIILDYRH